MFRRGHKGPTVILIGRKGQLWLGALAGLVLILGLLWVWPKQDDNIPHTHFSAQTSLPVNAPADSNPIQFQFEPLKPDETGENYFVNYRLQREEYRQETKAMLARLFNSSVGKTKEQAQEKWLELSSKIEKEGEIENLLKIKGFRDSAADVLPDSVTVFVYAANLTAGEISMIQDIIIQVTNVRLDKITVATKN